uniref:Tensin-1 n=1 Tax=Sphaerodactylus townsendi TaxID=933632 RepID=A0ACB8G244_9SAUR
MERDNVILSLVYWFSLQSVVERVQSPREKSPEETEGPVRRRTTSEGQYENSPEDPRSPRSPTARSPVHCVSPEVVSTISANPGGRPKEPHLHSYKEAFEEMQGTSPSSPPSSGEMEQLFSAGMSQNSLLSLVG